VGDRVATAAALCDLQATYRLPVVERRGGVSLSLTLPRPEAGGTLILHDVLAFSRGEQQMLSDWLGDAQGATQVITISAVALFPFVESGEFLSTLYYRLNVIYVEAGSADAAMERSA
jgi:hypothetical protein